MTNRVSKTITVDATLAKWVEEQIENKEFYNFSHAVDIALQALKGKMSGQEGE